MSSIVEVDDQGVIQLPDELLAVVKPRTRFTVELQGATADPPPGRDAAVLEDRVTCRAGGNGTPVGITPSSSCSDASG